VTTETWVRTTAAGAVLWAASATADLNGYASRYGVDLGVPPPCDLTVTSADSLATIEAALDDPLARCVCFEPGDYTGVGIITLHLDGTPTARRWARLAGDSVTHPVELAVAQRATLKGLQMNGADHWVLHRLAFTLGSFHDGVCIAAAPYQSDLSSDGCVYDRLLIDGCDGTGFRFMPGNNSGGQGQHFDNVIQKTVVRNATPVDPRYGSDHNGVAVAQSNLHIVDSEISNVYVAIDVGLSPFAASEAGLVVENCDLFVEPTYYYDGSGRPSSLGPYSASKGLVWLGQGGSAQNPVRFLHNRLWGARTPDTTIVGSMRAGGGFVFQLFNQPNSDLTDVEPGWSGPRFVEFANNLIFDSEQGLVGYWQSRPDGRLSIVGNLIFDLRSNPNGDDTRALELRGRARSEVYFNTVLRGGKWLDGSDDVSNLDVRCNLVAQSEAGGLAPGTGTQVDFNGFYASPPLTTELPHHDLRLAADPDAGAALCFFRRLLSGPERVCVRGASPTAASPHRGRCDPAVGSRAGIGVDDAVGPWRDWLGTARSAPADLGALQYAGLQCDAGSCSGQRSLARKTASPPTVDGALGEFEQAEPLQVAFGDGGATASVRLLWDDQALYVAAEVTDRDLQATGGTRDGILASDDGVELAFDTGPDRGADELPRADDYLFKLSARNIQGDRRGGNADPTWDPSWTSVVTPHGTLGAGVDVDTGYSMELRIPWASWGVGPPPEGTTWGLEVILHDRTAGALSRQAWANTTGGNPYDPDGWGQVVFSAAAPSEGDGGVSTTPASPQAKSLFAVSCGCASGADTAGTGSTGWGWGLLLLLAVRGRRLG
jgi:MYXO-CTERM domain-containing protein